MKKYIFTAEEFARLKKEKAADPKMTMTQFARRTGINPNTVAKAVSQSEFHGQVIEMFPMMKVKQAEARRRETEMQRLSVDQIGSLGVDTSLLHVRAAVMEWRKVA